MRYLQNSAEQPLVFRKNLHLLFIMSFPLAALYFPIKQSSLPLPGRMVIFGVILLACILAFVFRISHYVLISERGLLVHRGFGGHWDKVILWPQVHKVIAVYNKQGGIEKLRLETVSDGQYELAAFVAMEQLLKELRLRLPENAYEKRIMGMVTLRAVGRRILLILSALLVGAAVTYILWWLI